MPDDSYNYANDPTFLGMSPSDQMHYLSSQDSDFQKMQPQDQLGYLAHLRGLGPISGPAGAPPSTAGMPGKMPFTLPSLQGDQAQAATAGLPGGSPNIQPASDTATAVGAGAIGAAGLAVGGPPALSALRSGIQAHPFISQVIASGAIGEARNIPYVGKYIPPGSELLPFLAGKGETPTRPEGMEAENVGQPVAIGKVSNPGPRPNGPYSGPNTPASMEPTQSGMIARHGYVPETQTAVIEFNNGKVYDYKGVPKEMYDNFRNAESQGSYFAQNLKGRYTTAYRGTVSPTAGSRAKQALSRTSQ